MFSIITRRKKFRFALYVFTGIYILTWTYPNPIYFTQFERKEINTFDYKYVINPSHICSGENKPSLLIIVLSTIKAYKKREAIRKTWGSKSWGSVSKQTSLQTGRKSNSVAVLFFFGVDEDEQQNIQLEEEAKQYGDVLQIDILETYGLNVTKKILTAFKWTLEYCPSLSHLMKVDDDIFIDVPAVQQRMETSDCGLTLCGHKVYVPLTTRSGKYAIGYSDYPFILLPPYLFGYFYVMPTEVVGQLLSAAKYVPLMRMEDVYITGILPRVQGVRITPFKRFFAEKDYRVDLCDFVTGKRSVNIVADPQQIYALWDTYRNSSLCF